MKTKNMFFVMLVLLIGASSQEIKAQKHLSEASWIKWYKPDPKDANKNLRIYRSATAEELSQIAINVKNGKIVGGKTYELPGSSNTRFILTQPDLWYEYWLMSYRTTDKTVTKENLPEAMARSSVFTWDNNFAGRTINNYYYSQSTKTVQYIPNYSGLSAGVPIVVYTDGSIKGKADCTNPGPENGVKTGSTKKDTVFIVNNSVEQPETETEVEEEECWEYVWKTQTTYTTEYVEVHPYNPRGDYTGYRGLQTQSYMKAVRVPHKTKTKIKVPCGEGFQEEEEIPYTENDEPERTWCERHPVLCAKLMNTNLNIGVGVQFSNQNVSGGTLGGFNSVTPGGQSGGVVVTPGGQSEGFQPATPGKRLGQ